MESQAIFSKSENAALQLLESSEHGLSSAEALTRHQQFGPNRLTIQKKASVVSIFVNQFKNTLVLILIAAAVLLAYLGISQNDSSNFLDAGLILSIVFLNAVFGFAQDFKAEKSIELLKKMVAPKALVLRDQQLVSIDAQFVVPGDILVLEEGDLVAADARIVKCKDLETDESSLTGESTPVKKKTGVFESSTPLAERANMVFSSSRILKGHGLVLVTGIGAQTELGKIAVQVQQIKETQSPFQIEMEELGKRISIGILVIIVIVALVQLFLHEQTSLVQVFVAAIALAVAAIPEGLPAVITLTLAINTQKMVQKNALVRKLSVIEDLGAVDIICSDKTGTLTEGTMAVTKTIIGTTDVPLENWNKPWTSEMQLFWNTLVLNNNSKLVNQQLSGSYTEKALLNFAVQHQNDWQAFLLSHPRLDEQSFSHETKRMITLNRFENQNWVLAKGATERVLELCTQYFENGQPKPLSESIKKQISAIEENLARQSLRMLAIAAKETKEKTIRGELVFVGLVGLSDPVRVGVKEAVLECTKAGIRVKMITGDKALTAQAIARQIGLNDSALTGPELDGLTDPTELGKKIVSTDVFARVEPRHKVLILSVLQKKGHVVAMTGDGVNDAPALKAADVGIAMGIRGTEVAKEASELVLTDDHFLSIVEAIRLGRNSFLNIRKFVNYLLTSNFAEVSAVFIASLAGFVPLTAIHLLLINLFTDGAPAIALGLDPPHQNIMQQKPKPKKEGVINKRMGYLIIGMGIQLTIIILAVVFIGHLMGGTAIAQTMAFSGFVLFEFNRIAVIRQTEKTPFFSNKWLTLAILLTLAVLLFLVYSPFNTLFDLVPLGLEHWAVLVAGLLVAWVSGQVITKQIMQRTEN